MYQQYLGQSAGALPARTGRDPFVCQAIAAPLDEVYRTGVPYVAPEVPMRRARDGSPKDTFFTFTYQPLRDATGAVEGILLLALDVTTQVQARRRSEDLARAREEFLSSAAHDLKNPLTSIRAQARLVGTPPARPSGGSDRRTDARLAHGCAARNR